MTENTPAAADPGMTFEGVLEEVEIVIVSKRGCPYCVQAKTMLDRMGESYIEFPIEDADMRQSFYDEQGLEGDRRTVPQVFLKGTRVGGYNDLVARVAEGGLR